MCSRCREKSREGRAALVKRLEQGGQLPACGPGQAVPELLTLEESEGEGDSEEELVALQGLDVERLVAAAALRLQLSPRVQRAAREVEVRVGGLEQEQASTRAMFFSLEEQVDRARQDLYMEEHGVGEQCLQELLLDDSHDGEQGGGSDLTEDSFSTETRSPLTVGSRCLVRDTSGASSPGTVAEPPKQINGGRLLVFHDSGLVGYYREEGLGVGAGGQPGPWVRSYLGQYPERAMVRLAPGQQVELEWRGEEVESVVEKVDCSLALLRHHDGAREWIYRGDPRLGALQGGAGGRGGKRQRPVGGPVVEYKRFPEADATGGSAPVAAASGEADALPPAVKAVARKSTSGQGRRAREVTAETERAAGEGEVRSVPWQPSSLPAPYTPHSCSTSCVSSLASLQGRQGAPLLAPLHSGWARSAETAG